MIIRKPTSDGTPCRRSGPGPQAAVAARNERHRRFWHGFWTLVGIGAIVLLTVSVTLSARSRVSEGNLVTLGSVALLAGLFAFLGRENHRRD